MVSRRTSYVPILSVMSANLRIDSVWFGHPWISPTLLALCPPHPYLSQNNRQVIFPNQAYEDTTASPGPGANNEFRYGRLTMKTYLRPEFNLSDAVHDDPTHTPSLASTTPAVRTGRAGDDIVARDVLAFDIRIFDPLAPIYTGVGADNQPGVAGVDDDSSSTNDDISELGWGDSDDIRVGVGDPMIRDVMETTSINAGATAIVYERTDQGDFVDLNYARLAGGPVMGTYFDASRNGNTVAPSASRTLDRPRRGGSNGLVVPRTFPVKRSDGPQSQPIACGLLSVHL